MEVYVYNQLEFEEYCKCTDGTLAECVVSFTQIVLEHFNRDFLGFCRKYEPYIVSHGERLREGVNFKIPLTSDYTLYITSDEQNITAFQIIEKTLNLEIESKPYIWQ